MPLPSDHNGIFIKGMTDSTELGQFLQRKYTQEEMQDAFVDRVQTAHATAKSEKITPLQGFWKQVEGAYGEKRATLKCQAGCGHCCHTGVEATQLEWDGIVNHARENGIDLNAVIARSQKSIDRIKNAIDTEKDESKINWHRLVINQPCPFLNEDQTCMVYEDRPLDCRMVVAYRDVCTSKNLEHAQRGVRIEEAVGSTVIAKLQHDLTPKMKRRKFTGVEKVRLLQYWLILWQKKYQKKKKR